MLYASFEQIPEYWLDVPVDTRRVLRHCTACGEELKEYDDIYRVLDDYYCQSCVESFYMDEEHEKLLCDCCGRALKEGGEVYYALPDHTFLCGRCMETKTLYGD